MTIEMTITDGLSDSETSLTTEQNRKYGHIFNETSGIMVDQMDCFGRHAMDIYSLPQHVQVGFEEIFRVPESLDQGDIGQVLSSYLNRVLGFVYSYTQGAIYYFLTIITGIPLSLMWGVAFGVINYVTVWFIQPAAKLFYICLHIISIPTTSTVRVFADPVFLSIGQVFRLIAVKLKLKVEAASVEDVKKNVTESYRLCNKQTSKYHKGTFAYPPEWLGFV